MTPIGRSIAFATALVLAAPSLQAEISRKEKKEAKGLFDEAIYMRLDAPCQKGRHPYGVYYSPLVDVSPEGPNTGAIEGETDFSWYHAESTIWAVRINDPVELEDLDWDEEEGTVEIELEGTGSADGRNTVIRFIGIRSLSDFRAAFEHAFSPRPLQEEHPEWPAAIREAIAERRLENGMTKRQAYYVVGMPARVEKTEEGGKAIEVWTLPSKGMEVSFFGISAGNPSGAPETLRFEDSALVSASVAQSGPGALDLDD